MGTTEQIALKLRRLVADITNLNGEKETYHSVLGTVWDLADKGRIKELDNLLRKSFPDLYDANGKPRFKIGIQHVNKYGTNTWLEIDNDIKNNGSDPTGRDAATIAADEAMRKLKKRRRTLGATQL